MVDFFSPPEAGIEYWVPLSPEWAHVMKQRIMECTGTHAKLLNFKRGCGGNFTQLISPNGKTVYVFSGLQIDNSNHVRDRDNKAEEYESTFMITSFESPDGKYSGFVGGCV